MDLRQKIKNFFIPSLQNQLRPYSLRFGTLFFVVALSIAIEIAFYAYVNVAFKKNQLLGSIISSIQSTVAETLPQVIAQETNKERIEAGGRPLSFNEQLAKAARLKAEDMITRGYFAHQGPTGEMAWDWMQSAGYEYSYAGENLAVNFFDAGDVVKAWMKSPTHRSNILNGAYRDIGIAAVRGILEGRETVVVVQMFGTPAAPEPAGARYASKPAPVRKDRMVLATTSVAVATETPALSTTTTISFSSEDGQESGAVVLGELSAGKKYLVSPRHLARDAYVALLVYMFLCLIIPMFMIYYRHVSNDRWLRFKEIFILFRQPIISALVTFVCVTAVMAANFAWSQRGTYINQAAVSKVEKIFLPQ